jgi:hypothetical protein
VNANHAVNAVQALPPSPVPPLPVSDPPAVLVELYETRDIRSP